MNIQKQVISDIRYLSQDMQMVCDIIGNDATEKLINELGGISIYIPKPSSISPEDVIDMLRSCRQNVKLASCRLGLSQSRVYTIRREYKEIAPKKYINVGE